MAQFMSRGALKPLFDSKGLGSTDRFLHKLGLPLHVERRRLGSSGKSFSSCSRRYSTGDVRACFWQKMNEEAVLGGDYYDDELSCFGGIVLDLAYRPVNVVCWRRAICLEFMEKADVLEYYDQTVNSPSRSFYIPAVLKVPQLLQVVMRRRVQNNLSRRNILYRDNYTCQYCSSCNNLMIDHVLPISCGGEWTWENPVTACSRCNLRKGQKTIEEANMKLLKVPKAPKDYDDTSNRCGGQVPAKEEGKPGGMAPIPRQITLGAITQPRIHSSVLYRLSKSLLIINVNTTQSLY